MILVWFNANGGPGWDWIPGSAYSSCAWGEREDCSAIEWGLALILLHLRNFPIE